MTFQAETERLMREKESDIAAFLRSQGIAYGLHTGQPSAVWKIAQAVAYELCRKAGWGGRERKIYAHDLPEFAGRECVADGVRFVKTGMYTLGGGGGIDGDYEPPYLSNETTHRIVATSLIGNVRPDDETWWPRELEIEAANVELIEKGQPQ